MKLFLRKRFGVGTDFGSSGSELGGRPSSTSAVKAVGKGASDVLASEEGGVKEVLHASEGTRRFRFENRSSSGPGKEGSPENSGLLSERVRGGDHLQLRSSRAGPILSRGVAPVENHSGSALKRSQNGEKHSDTRSSERPSRSSPAARVFFSTRTSSTSQLLIKRNAGNREEGIEARRLRSESATASNDADNSDATILHPRDAQEDAKRKESPKRRRLHGAILNAGERNSLTLSPSVLYDSGLSNNSSFLSSEPVGAPGAEKDRTEMHGGEVDRVAVETVQRDSSSAFRFPAIVPGDRERSSDGTNKPSGDSPSVFVGSESAHEVKENIHHLQTRSSRDASSAEPLEVSSVSDLNRGPPTGSFDCALSSSEDENEEQESFPGENVKPKKKLKKLANVRAPRAVEVLFKTKMSQARGNNESDSPGQKRLRIATAEGESEPESETSSGEKAGAQAEGRPARKKRGPKKGRRGPRGQAAAAKFVSEPDISASPGLEAGVGPDRGFQNGEDLDTFFQESQLEEPNLGGGEALTAQHIHEIPDIPMEMLQALKGGDEQVGQEPSPARHDPRGQGNTSVSLEVDRHRNERASTESAEGTLLGHDQIVTSEPLVQPPIVPDLDSFFTESAAGLTRSANASAQEESTIRGAVEAALGSSAGDRPELREALPASAPSESDERVNILERQLANLLASIPANAANTSDPRVDTLEREFAHIHERENAQDSHLKEIGAMLTSLVQNSSAADEKFAMISARMTEQEAGSNYLQQASLFASSEKVKSLEQVVEASRKKDRVLKAHIQEFSALLDTVILRKISLDTAQTSRGTLRPSSRVVAETATPSTRSMSAIPGESSQKEFRFSNSGEIHVSEERVEAVRGEASSEPPHDQKIVEDFLKLSCEDDSPLGRTQGVVPFRSGKRQQVVLAQSVVH